MAITAKLVDAAKRDDGWKLKVEFTDGVAIKVANYRFNGQTTNDLVDFVRSKVNKAEDNKTSDYSALVGKTLDVTPDPQTPPVPPTQPQIDRKVWLTDWNKLRQVESVLTSIPALETTARRKLATDLQASLAAGWKNSYLGDI